MTTPHIQGNEEIAKAQIATLLTPLIKQIFHGENFTSENIHKELDLALDGIAKLLTTKDQACREAVEKERERIIELWNNHAMSFRPKECAYWADVFTLKLKGIPLPTKDSI